MGGGGAMGSGGAMGAPEAMGDEDDMTGGLGALMKLGRKATPKPEEEDEEGEEGSDESENEQVEPEDDDMSAGEDEDEDMIRIARERAAANEPQSMLMQMAEMTAEAPKPKAEATHRRKGVPLKSIQRARSQNGQAGYEEHTKDHSKQMSMWQQQVREQTRMVDASSIVLGESVEDGGSANSTRGGAQRRRKQLCPAPSLLPLF